MLSIITVKEILHEYSKSLRKLVVSVQARCLRVSTERVFDEFIDVVKVFLIQYS